MVLPQGVGPVTEVQGRWAYPSVLWYFPLSFRIKGSTFWSESDLSRTTLGRWIHNILKEAPYRHVRWHIPSEPAFIRTSVVNLLFHLLTPYKLGQRTEVPFSFIKTSSNNIFSHVCLVRGSTERRDTQRLNEAVHDLRR